MSHDRATSDDHATSALLLVTAVEAERDALLAGLGDDPAVRVIVGGVGPAESAAATVDALAGGSYRLVLSTGIGGGFSPLTPGGLAVASMIAFADLGGELPDGGFAAASQLGFGVDRYPVAPALTARLAAATGATPGAILTVSTATGTAATAAARRACHPAAVAEAMEGAGVAAAATRRGVSFGELRAISNVAGPRDRSAWRIGDALAALRVAGRALAADLPGLLAAAGQPARRGCGAAT